MVSLSKDGFLVILKIERSGQSLIISLNKGGAVVKRGILDRFKVRGFLTFASFFEDRGTLFVIS